MESEYRMSKSEPIPNQRIFETGPFVGLAPGLAPDLEFRTLFRISRFGFRIFPTS